MRKLSEFRDEEALELLADLLQPLSQIASDSSFRTAWKSGAKVYDVAKLLIKGHKSEVMDIMASLEGVPREEFHCNVLTLPMMLVSILNDEDFMAFFASAGQSILTDNSGSVTEIIEEEEQPETSSAI